METAPDPSASTGDEPLAIKPPSATGPEQSKASSTFSFVPKGSAAQTVSAIKNQTFDASAWQHGLSQPFSFMPDESPQSIETIPAAPYVLVSEAKNEDVDALLEEQATAASIPESLTKQPHVIELENADISHADHVQGDFSVPQSQAS